MVDMPPPTLELDGACLRLLRMADADALYPYLRDPAVTERTSYPEVTVPRVDAMYDLAPSAAEHR